MNIALVSDLHLEFHADGGESFCKSLPDFDTLVVAGDAVTISHRGLKSLHWLCQKAKNVVYVAGNHEYYGTSPEKAHKLLAEFSKTHPNFHWLNRGVVEIDGQRFVGASLWFRPTATAQRNREWLNDFSLIEGFSHWWPEQNRLDEAFLEKEVREGDIVVTHHLPSFGSVAAQYLGSPYNCYFVCDQERVILSNKPKLWLHGHTHDSCDYRLGETRVVCNPFGYSPFATNPSFKETLSL